MQVLEICAITIENDKIRVKQPAGFILQFFQKENFKDKDIEEFVHHNHRLCAGIKHNISCYPMMNKDHFYYAKYNKQQNQGFLIITDARTDLADRLMEIVENIYAGSKDIMDFKNQTQPIIKNAIKYINDLDHPQPKPTWKDYALMPFRKAFGRP